MRPVAINMSHVARFADAFPVAAMVSTLSRHLRWNHFVNLQQMHKDGITAWEDEKKAAQVFYVAATRAIQRLVVGGVQVCATIH
jgi:ATP-dependent exoDNAse (exonuclease V) beta subunit